ncbi:CTP synthase [candidate division WWE3 bacterium]|uniref:CTP synthase n=1 Tax=candidate division WWE3 bacterium TaxID=2053526 RepID=A0A928TSQ2_UNCKA|nr:CTP synthase [candidate division WWE3 bacterium]
MPKRRPARKFVFVTGGVMSGVGKGVATASIGALLKARGLRVTAVKIDPYLNVDPGTMNPVEHGEVFVTEDGLETDQDLGNYERFLDENLHRVNYMTTGIVYLSVIERERSMGYGGKTVEAVPHIPLEVIDRIKAAAEDANADVTMIEIGGTVGEYQNVLYLEACRMMKLESPKDVMVVLVSYLPVPSNLGEMKTKPTQYACRTLNAAGLQPDMLICRGAFPLDDVRKRKLSINCNVPKEAVISAPDVSSIYEVPLKFNAEHVTDRIVDVLDLPKVRVNLEPWVELNERIASSADPVHIGVIGKYFSTGDFTLSDAYLSVLEAIKHAAWSVRRKPEIEWLNSEEFEKNPKSVAGKLKHLDGILIPGGFGSRGVEGKIMAIQYSREHGKPYLGLCYGLQLAVIEVARHVLKLGDAASTEFEEHTPHPIIHLMNEQEERMKHQDYGGSMRLGNYPCRLRKGSRGWELYGKRDVIEERHRHRYEVNPDYRKPLEDAGLIISGTSPDGKLAEIIELKDHPFFMASQFHPEFTSRPFRPNPLFLGFLKSATGEGRGK